MTPPGGTPADAGNGAAIGIGTDSDAEFGAVAVDLSNCEREPIHIPGAIQPHGVLLACRGAELRIVQLSDNAADHLGIEAVGLLGRPIAELFDDASWQRLQAAAAAGLPRERNPIALDSRDRSRSFDGIAHHGPTPDIAIIELEARSHAPAGFHPRMRGAVRQLQGARSLVELYDAAAREVRALTGFDRVMVYRFDADWNGEVVAEARDDRLETFLGLHYPAADIPAQARRLYTLNWLRIIPDIGYRPSPLLRVAGEPATPPLDLSFAVLRSVSPIHVEYLSNMGVTASMSVSLLRDGELIGLIACHHYSGPHHIAHIVRDSAEFFGQALSWHIASFEARETAERTLATHHAERRIVEAIEAAASLPEGLCTPALLQLTGADGACVRYEGRIRRVGRTPDDDAMPAIVAALAGDADGWLHATDHLAKRLPQAAAWDDVAAGVIALEISRELGEYVLWFRPASERSVDWAGDPRKHAVVDAGGVPRLSPRGSFALWRETVRGRSLPWQPWQIEAAANLRRMLLGHVRRQAEQLRTLNDKLAAADRMKDEFLATVGHELRTPLSAMLGWLQILRREEAGGASPQRQQRAFDVIERNARAQAQLIDDLLDTSRIAAGKLTMSMQRVEVGSLVERSLDVVRPAADAKQITLDAALDSTAIVSADPHRLQQAVVNLLSNAVKFTPRGGRVQVLVEQLEGHIEISVADSGQGIAAEFLPHVFDRFRQADGAIARSSSGLGLGLAIVRHIIELHGGSVRAASEGAGRGATFTLQLPALLPLRADAGPRRAGESAHGAALAGLRVLVVDDDADGREMLLALLGAEGIDAMAAASAFEALELLAGPQLPDLIVSDIGMPEMDGFSFIEQLRRREPSQGGRVPAIALSAHTREDERERALRCGFDRHVPKPLDAGQLFEAVAALAPRRA